MSAAVLSRPEVAGAGGPGSSPRGRRTQSDRGFFTTRLSASPWRVGDVVRLGTRLLLGVVGIAGCWAGASGTVDFRQQIGWTAGAVLAAIVAASGGVAWALAGLGTVGKERRRLVASLRETLPAAVPVDVPPQHDGLVVGAGMRRYHRPTCDVVRGKDVRPTTGIDLRPCGMCLS